MRPASNSVIGNPKMLSSTALDPSSPLKSAVSYLKKASPLFDWVGIYLREGDELVLGPFEGEKPEHIRIPIGKGICGRALAEDNDLVVQDVRKEENYLACSLKTRSEMVALIRDSSNQVIGEIDVDSDSLGAFGPQEEQLIRNVAERVGELWNA